MDIISLIDVQIYAMQMLHGINQVKYSFAVSFRRNKAWTLPMGAYQISQAFDAIAYNNDNDPA